jgi:hypothetical protein
VKKQVNIEDNRVHISLLGLNGKYVQLVLVDDKLYCKLDEEFELFYEDEGSNNIFLIMLKKIYNRLGLQYMSHVDLMHNIASFAGLDIDQFEGNSIGLYLDLNYNDDDDDELVCDLLMELNHYNKDAYSVVCRFLKTYPLTISEVSDEFQTDKNLIIDLIDLDERVLDAVPDSVKDVELLEIVIQKNHRLLQYFSKEVINNSPTVMNQLREWIFEHPELIKKAPNTLTNDKELIEHVVRADSQFIQYASDSLKSDAHIIKLAIENSLFSVSHIPIEHIRSNPTIIELIIDKQADIKMLLDILTPELLDDKDIVLHLVNKRGAMLEYASDRLKLDGDVVQAAISNNPASAVYVPADYIKVNLSIVKLIIDKSHNQQHLIDILPNDILAEISDNKDIVLHLVERYGPMIQMASQRLKNDIEVVTKTLSRDYFINIKYIQKSMISTHPELFKLVLDFTVNNSKSITEYVVNPINDNKECMLQLVTKFGEMIQYVSDRLKCDTEMIRTAIVSDCNNLQYVPDCSKYYSDLIVQNHIRAVAFSKDIHALKYASDTIRSDLSFFIQLMEEKLECLLYLSDSLKNNKIVIEQLYELNNESIVFASKNILLDKEYMERKLLNIHDKIIGTISKMYPADLDIHKTLLDINCCWFDKFNSGIQLNLAIVQYAVCMKEKQMPATYILAEHLSFGNTDNLELMLHLIKTNGKEFQSASSRLRRIKRFVMQALEDAPNDHAEIYAHSLGPDEDIMLLVASKCKITLKQVHRDLAMKIVSSGYGLYSIREQFSDDREIVLMAVTMNSKDFRYASFRLRGDKEIATIAVQSDPTMIQYIANEQLLKI